MSTFTGLEKGATKLGRCTTIRLVIIAFLEFDFWRVTLCFFF